jgi:aldehyde:ferredoxin oxidoreductase
MLGVTNAFQVLMLIDTCEKMGLDVISAGVALAWATEALERGVVSEKETLLSLQFGDAQSFKEALLHLGKGTNDFYRVLGRGAMKAAAHYGGAEFACVLGQEMAGYATGEVFFISQALGFRHSHLDAAGYAYDQKDESKDIQQAVDFLVKDEEERVFLTSMVACLFARGVYSDELLSKCLHSVGYDALAEERGSIAPYIQKLRWKIRIATGFDPETVTIPKRFNEIVTWKGPIDADYLSALKKGYAQRILHLARGEDAAERGG